MPENAGDFAVGAPWQLADSVRSAPEGIDLHEAKEGWEEAARGRVAPMLDGPGDVPPNTGLCEKHGSAGRVVVRRDYC
jgi:hypothetical protein